MTSRGWAGFSDEDIKNVQRGGGGGPTVRSQRPARFQPAGKAGPRGVLAMVRGTKATPAYAPIPPQARLTQPQEPESPRSSSGQQTPESCQTSPAKSLSPVPPSPCTSPSGSQAKNVKIRLGENNSYEVIPSSSPAPQESPQSPRPQEDGEGGEEEPEEDFLFDKGGGREEEGALLENLQQRQKVMEAQNKKRRELLIKAIADRSRRTQSEAQKLKHIESELAKLDSLLSSDVAILRNQIEGASLEFNEAQKRYEKAEKEFIEAKLQLFNRLERKELLTEHLCRIIEANERRKALKLSQLMAQLEVVDCVGELPSPPHPCQSLPQLASLDEVTYAACTTLKHPQRAAQALQAGLARINGNLSIEEIKRAVEEQEEKEEENVEEEYDGGEEVVRSCKAEEDHQRHCSESEVRGEGEEREVQEEGRTQNSLEN